MDNSQSTLDFYARHGFVCSTTPSGAAPGGRALLSGDRDAALTAIRGSLDGGAVGMNLMARLLHDAGDLQGAVDAYLKALEASVGRRKL